MRGGDLELIVWNHDKRLIDKSRSSAVSSRQLVDATLENLGSLRCFARSRARVCVLYLEGVFLKGAYKPLTLTRGCAADKPKNAFLYVVIITMKDVKGKTRSCRC